MFLTDLNNWKYIILVKSISNRRKTILVIIILFNIFILKKQIDENDFNKNILLVISLNKY